MTANTARQDTTAIERQEGKRRERKKQTWKAKLDIHQWFERQVAPNLSQIAVRLYRAVLDGSVDWGAAGTAVSVGQLAEHCALSERSIRNAKRELQDAGLLGTTPSGDNDVYYPARPVDREWEPRLFSGVKRWHNRMPRPVPATLWLLPGVGSKGRRPANSAGETGKRCRTPIVYIEGYDQDSERTAIATEQVEVARSANALRLPVPVPGEEIQADGQPGQEPRRTARRLRGRRRSEVDRRRRFAAWMESLSNFVGGQVALYVCGDSRSRPDVAMAYGAELEALDIFMKSDEYAGGLELSDEVPAALDRARRAVETGKSDRWGFDAKAWREFRADVALYEVGGLRVPRAAIARQSA